MCVQAGKALLNGLFTLNPILRNALFRLRGLCIGVEKWSLFEYSNTKTYTLEEFVELQGDKRSNVAHWLQTFASDVRSLIRSSCDEVLDGFLVANGIHADHKMTFMERAALRTECRCVRGLWGPRVAVGGC
jgi:dynein heavy chain